jgi:hypothetical protein
MVLYYDRFKEVLRAIDINQREGTQGPLGPSGSSNRLYDHPPATTAHADDDMLSVYSYETVVMSQQTYHYGGGEDGLYVRGVSIRCCTQQHPETAAASGTKRKCDTI